MKIGTKCVQEGYKPQNGEPRVLPINQSTTFKYDSSAYVGDLFDLKADGHMYSRISNPTLSAVEEKIAALEGGVGALLTSAGQSAALIAILNICEVGGHVIASGKIYGGSFNLLDVTLRRLGISTTFVDPSAPAEKIEKLIRPETRAIYGETLSNPTLDLLDIEKFAGIAHKHGLPLIVDNTFPTPILCRPFEFGADIVTHSATKYMDGHACIVGGVIVDGGKFDWENGNFPGLTTPDSSYHGVVYTRDHGEKAYITKARVQLMRDLGCTMSPMSAFLLNNGLETLHLRMERHSQNALAIAEYLENDPRISWVNYPGLKSSPYAEQVKKYLPYGCSGVVSFGLKGGREEAARFIDGLEMAAIVVHVADVRSSALHPASMTHRQMSEAQLAEAGVLPELVRMSIGIEDVEDIKADIVQALKKCTS